MIPVRIDGPEGELVTLDDAKRHCRIDGDDDDSIVRGYIGAAIAHLDGYRGILGRSIMPQKWKVDLPCAGTHRLPLPDVIKVSATDTAGDLVAVNLVQDARGSSVILASAATVEFTAAMPEELRPSVRVAVLLLVGHWYENREVVVTGTIATALPMAVESLLAPIRWYSP